MDARTLLLETLAGRVLAVARPHPVRVAVDGCSAAGKTTLAGELAAALRTRTTRPVLRASVDDFTKPAGTRTAYPPHTPESYYLDTWDPAQIRADLLLPLGPAGDGQYRTAPGAPTTRAPGGAILLADGIFLQRPELDPHWDLRIYLHVGFDVVLERGVARDHQRMGGAAEAERRYRTKYLPAERRYVTDVRPAERADVLVDNTDPATPVLLRDRLSRHRSRSG
ncbi:uridylate kinase [Phytohabitans houttuyneae]|uniref:uridylate kinase n=1 Tax=Phytohabitans houttuyneae TaxID=1076126 RepID=UPI001C49960A|nr:uridylate kinase [Phytohabitans houttuyneae]